MPALGLTLPLGLGTTAGGSVTPLPPPVTYVPALKFNDARNSQYLLLFPWLGISLGGNALPANALTFGGEALTFGGEVLTFG